MKNKWLFIIGFLILVLTSCKAKSNNQTPTMDREKFTSLLLDVRLVEGTYGMDFERVDTMDRGIDKYFQQVFDKHGVSSRDFMTNYTFYSQNINDITAIEGEVIERLSKMQADLGMHNKPEEEKPKQ